LNINWFKLVCGDFSSSLCMSILVWSLVTWFQQDLCPFTQSWLDWLEHNSSHKSSC